MTEELRKRADRVDQSVRPRFAQPAGHERIPQNADNSYAGATSHLYVLRRISNIHATARFKTKLVNCKEQLHGMWLAMGHSVSKDTHSKKRLQSKCANLRANAPTAAAADQAQAKSPRKRMHDVASASVQHWALCAIEATPEAICFSPGFQGQVCGSINVMPIRRIMLR